MSVLWTTQVQGASAPLLLPRRLEYFCHFWRGADRLPRMIGKRILERRKLLNMSQAELGEHCGVSKATVSQWETDKTVPTGPNLVKAAVALRVYPEWLVGIEIGYRQAK